MQPITFKDHFSTQSGIYAKYRPGYPRELYTFLAGLTPEHALAWDCGTGNGQAAIGLAEFYDHIIATDPSHEQISNCTPHPKISYRVETAETNTLPANTADLLTVATALHWFDLDVFYKEAARVLKPHGVIAAWTANTPTVSPQVDDVIKQLHDDILGDYWLAENHLAGDGYANIYFPFQQIDCPVFTSGKTMTLEDMTGYLNTWSAVQRYNNMHGNNPVGMIQAALAEAWGNPSLERHVVWTLKVKAGRKL